MGWLRSDECSVHLELADCRAIERSNDQPKRESKQLSVVRSDDVRAIELTDCVSNSVAYIRTLKFSDCSTVEGANNQ